MKPLDELLNDYLFVQLSHFRLMVHMHTEKWINMKQDDVRD